MYLDALEHPEDYWVMDTEADDLYPTQFWCAVAINLGTGEEKRFLPEDMKPNGPFSVFYRSCRYVVGHNFLSWDAYHLGRLEVVVPNFDTIVDTLVLSYLYRPHLAGGHSIEAYGERFKSPKLEHSDWSKFSSAMLERCAQDTRLGVKVYRALLGRLKDYSEKSAFIEHHIRVVGDKQERAGFEFDVTGAKELCHKIEQELVELAGPIKELFPPKLVVTGEYKYRETKEGLPYKSFLRHAEQSADLKFNKDRSKYRTFGWKEFDITSPQQRVERLLDKGWVPTEFTEAGSPKVNEDALENFAAESGIPEIKAIARYVVLSSRLSMIKGWLKVLGPDDRIHGRLFTCGAATRRMRHQKPNTANIPQASPSVLYGAESRGLWKARPGRILVGYDASGLEMRGFGHYIGGGDAAKLYIEGDPHTANAEALAAAGIRMGNDPKECRHNTKTAFYAFLYGAGDKKLGAIVNQSSKVGAAIRAVLMEATPALGQAMEEIDREYNANNGLLQTIDGGYVFCQSCRAALNYKIQSAGGIVMKLASIKLDQSITRLGLDAIRVGDIHDEGQLDTRPDHAEQVGELAVGAIEWAGKDLGFLVPLTGDYKIGKNWAETH